MKLSTKQEAEIVVWEYFVLSQGNDWGERSDEEVKKFFEWSERGLHKSEAGRYGDMSYFQKLVWGKRWAGRHVHELYEPGVLSGAMPYCTFIDKETPPEVVEFLKKEMFKGLDATVIDRYLQILHQTPAFPSYSSVS